MTPEDLQTLLDNVVAEVNNVADFGGIIDPALLPIIAIGKAVDKQLPGLVATVDKWIQGNPPTLQDRIDLKQQLSVLGNPDLP